MGNSRENGANAFLKLLSKSQVPFPCSMSEFLSGLPLSILVKRLSFKFSLEKLTTWEHEKESERKQEPEILRLNGLWLPIQQLPLHELLTCPLLVTYGKPCIWVYMERLDQIYTWIVYCTPYGIHPWKKDQIYFSFLFQDWNSRKNMYLLKFAGTYLVLAPLWGGFVNPNKTYLFCKTLLGVAP